MFAKFNFFETDSVWVRAATPRAIYYVLCSYSCWGEEEEVLKIRFRPAVLCVRCPLWVC